MKTPPRELAQVERLQSGLVQFLIVIIMAVLALIVAIAYQRRLGSEIPVLAIVALLSCLYAMTRDRALRKEHAKLVRSLVARERQLDRMGEAIREGKTELGVARKEADKLGHRLDEITRLYRAISTVNSVPDPNGTLDAVVEAALALVAGDRGSLMLFDEDGKFLVIRSQRGLPEGIQNEVRIRPGEGVAGWVVEHGESVLLQGNASSDGRFTGDDNRPVRSSLSVPLRAHGEIVGVLSLGHTQGSEKAALDESDKSVAQIFAQHAAVAVQHAVLWKKTHDVG